MITYGDITGAYSAENIKQLGNKILVIDRHYGHVIGYDVTTYNGIWPHGLANKVWTDISNITTWDSAYDTLYGKPSVPVFGSNLIKKPATSQPKAAEPETCEWCGDSNGLACVCYEDAEAMGIEY